MMTDKERLEDIQLNGFGTMKYLHVDIRWLIDQAEKVESLENEKETFRRMITEDLKPSNVLLRKENKQLREALEHTVTRKMSTYLNTSSMNEDFIKVAQTALVLAK